MSCQDFQILMNRDLDGVLDPAGRTRLDSHVASCPRCSAEQGSLMAIRGAFRDLRHVDVRPGLEEKIVEAAVAPRVPVLSISRFALIPAAAAVLALCLVSGALGWRLKEPSAVVAGPNWKRVDEAQFRRFLADQLRLPEDRVDAIIKIRRDGDQKREAAQADLQDQFEKLQKAELEEIWKVLPADARERYLEHDRTFTPPTGSPR